MKRLLVLLALATLAAPAASAARIRVVRHPAEPCSFSLLPVFDAKAVAGTGLARGVVLVYGQTATCAQWTGFSPVDWAVVEAAPLDEQPAAYVTVAPNPTPAARSATLIVAGIRLEVAQEAAPAVTNPSLISNGRFDANISGWTWYEGRFPNGRGAASWSALDANGSPASGSIVLRDDGPGLAFQRLQCFPATKNTTYRFGAKVRTGAGTDRGSAAIALFTYPSTDCSGDYTDGETGEILQAEAGVWQESSFTMRTGSRTQSALLVLASSAVLPPFETWFDDVFVTSF